MTTIKCPHCSQNVSSSAKFCPECGSPLSPGKPKVKAKSSPGGTRDIIIIFGTIVVVLLGYLIFKDKPDPHAGHDHSQQGAQTGSPMITPAMLDQLPDDYPTLVSMGNQFMDEMNFAVAAEIYSRALAIDGSDPNVRTDYGACMHGMGNNGGAIEQFMTVVKAHPTHGIAHFNLGIVYFGMKQNDSAKYYWEKYLEIDPNGKAANAAKEYLSKLDG